MEQAVLEIPMPELLQLPDRAEYRSVSGRASARVVHRGDTIVVWATCDSLQRACMKMESECSYYKQALEEALERTSERRSHAPIPMTVTALLTGLASGVIITLKINRYGKKCT